MKLLAIAVFITGLSQPLVHAADVLPKSMQFYYQGEYKAALTEAAKELEKPDLTAETIQNRLRLARDILSQSPEIDLGQYEDLLRLAAKQKNSRTIRPKVPEMISEVETRSEPKISLSHAEKSIRGLDRKMVDSKRAHYEFLAVLLERQFKRSASDKEWLFWIGKLKSLLSFSGTFYLEEYLKDGVGKNQAHLKEAHDLVEKEKDLAMPGS